MLRASRRAWLGRSGASVLTGLPLHLSTAAPELPDAASVALWPTSPHKKSGSTGRSASGWRTAAAPHRSRPGSAGSRTRCATATPSVRTEELPSLSSRIDRAVKSGALHRNNGARKKARAERIRSRPRGPTRSWPAPGPVWLRRMETRLLIGGEQVAGDGDSMAVENPATEETLADLKGPVAEQVDAAIAAADEAAFSAWAEYPRGRAGRASARGRLPHARAHRRAGARR